MKTVIGDIHIELKQEFVNMVTVSVTEHIGTKRIPLRYKNFTKVSKAEEYFNAKVIEYTPKQII